ncbi:hypothetical protein BDV28DRAFT_148971 [Aspergillus coremiiformis]|uniref:Arrestin-like N-terminal domain-containing protein n=1 Tax=Aspergillus coremiiformis TaxID=138285 RepID=A0A5N6Z4B3_9EURO|nr:hypothetical protein BDV28DRAFT_148971 [Aspergillus coremiiformis]
MPLAKSHNVGEIPHAGKDLSIFLAFTIDQGTRGTRRTIPRRYPISPRAERWRIQADQFFPKVVRVEGTPDGDLSDPQRSFVPGTFLVPKDGGSELLESFQRDIQTEFNIIASPSDRPRHATAEESQFPVQTSRDNASQHEFNASFYQPRTSSGYYTAIIINITYNPTVEPPSVGPYRLPPESPGLPPMAVNLEILFSNTERWASSGHGDNHELPVFVSGQGIQGTIVVSRNDRRVPVSGMVTVAVEGTLYNHVDAMGESSTTLYHTCSVQQIINLSAVYPSQQIISHANQRYNFHFVVPNKIAGAVPRKYGQQIPSSMQIHFSQTSDHGAVAYCKGTCSIDYRIRARFITDDNYVIEKTRPFTLWTSQGRQPPVCTEDFPGEYRLSSFKTLRNPFFQPTGRLLVDSDEPLPLEFSPEKEGAATVVRVRLLYESLKDVDVGARLSPPRFSALVRFHLQASTFISIEPQRRSPATCDAPGFPLTFETRKSYPSQVRKLRFDRLELATGPVWESEADLTLLYDNPAGLTPSFSSLLVSRRYSLKIYMIISGHGHTALKLELPIQVVYTGSTFLQSDEIPSSNDPREEMPPAYSP